MQVYDVDEGYVPSQAVLEVIEWFDANDRELEEKGKISDPYTKEMRERMKNEPDDFSNSTSGTGEVN